MNQHQQLLLQNLAKALELSVHSKDPSTINSVTQFIAEQQLQPGYIGRLLTIIRSNQIEVDVTLAALTQLKVFLRKAKFLQWKTQEKHIYDSDRTELFKLLLDTTYNLCDSYQYSQILKDIIEINGKQYCSHLTFTSHGEQTQIEQKLQIEEQFKACSVVLLGIASSFFYASINKQTCFYQLLGKTLPKVMSNLQMVNIKLKQLTEQLNQFRSCDEQNQLKGILSFKTGQFWTIYYLNIKFACQSIISILPLNLHSHMFQWAQLAVNIIHDNCQMLVGKWQLLDKKQENFYYYHGVKWSIKYLSRFFKKYLIYQDKQEVTERTKQFVNNYFQTINEVVVRCLKAPIVPKIKYHLLVMFQMLFQSQYLRYFQSEILNQLLLILIAQMRRSPSDDNLARDYPQNFIQLQTNLTQVNQLSDCRMQSVYTIICVVQRALENIQLPQAKNTILNLSRTIQQLVFSQNDIQKQIGLHLFKKLANLFTRKQFQDFPITLYAELPRLIRSDSLWVQMRAFEVLGTYNPLFSSQEMLQIRNSVVQKMISFDNNLEGVQSILVMKSCLALSGFFRTKQLRDGVSQKEVVILLQLVLKILHKFQFQEVMSVFNYLVRQFAQELKEAAIYIVHQIKKQLLHYIHKEYQQCYNKPALKYNFQYQNIITQSVKSIQILIKVLVQQPNWKYHLQQVIVQLFYYILQNYNAQDHYLDQIMPILHAYLEQLDTLEGHVELRIIFRCLVYRIIGIRQDVKNQIQREGPQAFYLGIQNVTFPEREYLQKYLATMGCYIKLIPNQLLRKFNVIYSSQLQTTDMEMLTLMILLPFDRSRAQSYTEHNQEFSLLILIYLTQTHKNQLDHQLVKVTWAIIRRIITNRKYQLMKYALQLFCLWLSFRSDQQIYDYLTSLPEKDYFFIMQSLLQSKQSYGIMDITEDQQIVRVILGLSKLLELAIIRPQLKLKGFIPIVSSYVIHFCSQLKFGQDFQDQDRDDEEKLMEWFNYYDTSNQQKNKAKRSFLMGGSQMQDLDEQIDPSELRENTKRNDQQDEINAACKVCIQVMLKFSSKQPQLYTKYVKKNPEIEEKLVWLLDEFNLLQNPQYSQLINQDQQNEEEEQVYYRMAWSNEMEGI